MINHVRTLLGGMPPLPPEVTDGWKFGEEIIPPDFSPATLRALTSPLPRKFQRLFFGYQPQRIFQNLRLFQLLTFLHATPLNHWIFALDDRVTYLSWSSLERLQQFRPRCEITPVTQPGPTVLSDPFADENRGILEFTYTVSSSSVPSGEDFLDVTFPDSQLTLRIPRIPNQTWQVYCIGRIRCDLACLAERFLHNLSPADIDWLFPGRSSSSILQSLPALHREAFENLSRCFTEKTDILDRFSAAILALAYRIDLEGRR